MSDRCPTTVVMRKGCDGPVTINAEDFNKATDKKFVEPSVEELKAKADKEAAEAKEAEEKAAKEKAEAEAADKKLKDAEDKKRKR